MPAPPDALPITAAAASHAMQKMQARNPFHPLRTEKGSGLCAHMRAHRRLPEIAAQRIEKFAELWYSTNASNSHKTERRPL